MTERVALVTGAAKRVGAAIARALHGAGLNVAIHYHRSRAEAEKLAESLEHARPNSTLLLQADLLASDRLPRLIEATVERFGRLDVLVNNASSFHATPMGEIDEASWLDLLGTNLKAPLFLAQAAAPHLIGSRGAIVNITDIHADRPLKDYLIYSCAKAGLVALTKALAKELGPEVRVNAVAPGVAIWPEDDEHFPPEEQRAIIDHSSLKRAGTPEEMAAAVKFLALDASYVTGHIMNVDGGRSVNL